MDSSQAQTTLSLAYQDRPIKASVFSSPTLKIPLLPPAMSTPPATIILGLWQFATNEQIDIYVQGYKTLYPNTKIIPLGHSAAYGNYLLNALDAITTTSEKASLTGAPEIMIHLFGESGAAQACRLLRAYKVRTGQTLSVNAIVLDTVPYIICLSCVEALRSPTRVLSFLYATITALYVWILQCLDLFEDRCLQDRQELSDHGLLPPDAKKCYVFPDQDLMFFWDDGPPTDDPDFECERHEYTIKRSPVDESGTWTVEKEKFWLGIEDFWDSR